MRLKTSYQAIEHEKNNANQVQYSRKVASTLLRHKMNGLVRGLIIPDNLIAELEEYTERNSLANLVPEECREEVYGCCPRCLKAHMIKTAEQLGLSSKEREFLSLFVDGETGHHGYYMDGDELVKI